MQYGKLCPKERLRALAHSVSASYGLGGQSLVDLLRIGLCGFILRKTSDFVLHSIPFFVRPCKASAARLHLELLNDLLMCATALG
jgi:hypothetical protein